MENEELNEVYLGFVRLIGEENDGYFRYEFIFTDNVDEFWGAIYPYDVYEDKNKIINIIKNG